MVDPKETQKGDRLQVVLARFGLASRRGVVSMIEEGRVTVNGEVVREKGFRVVPGDKIIADGQTLPNDAEPQKRYFAFNKPKGVMTTMQDPNAERTIADFFKDVPERLFPVGRLDRDTTGLILMTNDGELAFRLMHPKFGVQKKYRLVVKGVVLDKTVARLEKGVDLEEGTTAPCKIEITEKLPQETSLTISIHEGKKRQIRRIFEKVGHYVVELERLSYGSLTLQRLGIRYGERRELNPAEVRALKVAAGL